MTMIEKITGRRPRGCPWRAFQDPVCADVINSSKWFESGQIATRLGADAPAHLIEGLDVYRSACNAAEADRIDRASKKSKR